MEIHSVLDTGLQGLQQSREKLNETAAEIASAGVAPKEGASQPVSANIAEQLVRLREHELAYKASAEVVRNADQLLSRLVDDMA